MILIWGNGGHQTKFDEDTIRHPERGVSKMFPTVAELLGKVCSCGRELCWRQLGLKSHKPYLLHVLWSVRILLEQTSYVLGVSDKLFIIKSIQGRKIHPRKVILRIFQDFMVVSIQILTRVMTECSLMHRYQCYRRTRLLHPQSQSEYEENVQHMGKEHIHSDAWGGWNSLNKQEGW